MSPETESPLNLAERLHTVFDSQVMNYGAYNLVYATGRATYNEPSAVDHQVTPQQHFILGYRRYPSEVIVAPFDPQVLASLGLPIAIDNTNLVDATSTTHGELALETTSGSSFDLNVLPLVEIETAYGAEVLEQEADADDFLSYIQDLVSV
ncbi:hypothetical protein [Rothia uropygialis]|uniref:hypothetical protein n=1 Tax=Kocuria sp. 36 TaxID=1415402 RepID=UPI00101C30B3|nr:hypothetical protein [Kocuria sp. 36]